MIVVKTKCSDNNIVNCTDNIKKLHKDVISIYHTQNEHLCFTKKDYDNKGHVKKSEYDKIKSKVNNSLNILVASKEFV